MYVCAYVFVCIHYLYANVNKFESSTFQPKRLLSIWLEEFIAKIAEMNPRFLALHLQEVGGKTYENSMEHVQEFIRNLCDAMFINDFKYVCIYMDEDFKSAEHFTVSFRVFNDFYTYNFKKLFGRHLVTSTLDIQICVL